MEVDNFAHAGVLVKFVGGLVLTFDSKADFWKAAAFENGKGMLEKLLPETSAAVISTNSELTHPAEARIFKTKRAADELLLCFY